MKCLVALFISSIICLILYLVTAVLIWYLDGINIHNEPIGALVIVLYLVIPFITIQGLFKEEIDYERM